MRKIPRGIYSNKPKRERADTSATLSVQRRERVEVILLFLFKVERNLVLLRLEGLRMG